MKFVFLCISLALTCIGFGDSPARGAEESSHPHGMDREPTDAAHDEHLEHIGVEGANAKADEIKGDLAIFTFVVFLLLLGILWKFAWTPISHGLEKREHHISDQIAAAERANAEAKQLLAQYEQKLASAQDEVRAIIEEARRDATTTQQEILAQARADAAAEMDRAKREVETAKDQALRELAETSANLAVELAGKVIRAQLDSQKHAQLVTEALSQFHAPSQN